MHRAFVVLILSSLCGCDGLPARSHSIDIEFATFDTHEKPDFARVERDFPLSTVELDKLTPDKLQAYTQAQIDQLYARLSAGPIPDDVYDAELFFPTDMQAGERFTDIAGALPEYPKDPSVLKSPVDADLILIPIITMHAKERHTLPARLRCGASLLDSRRESIVVEYPPILGYRNQPKQFASLRLHDELRMLRPGLYLGRAYAGEVLLFNFTLYNADVARRDGKAFVKTGHVTEDCWIGAQQRTLIAHSSDHKLLL